MELDWKAIAGVVAPLAPKLGTVLGGIVAGPIGSTIGGYAGEALAAAFGVEATPEAVGKAIAERPDAAEVIAQVEANEGERIRQETLVKIEALKQETEQYRLSTVDVQSARDAHLSLVNASSPISWGVPVLAVTYTAAFIVVLAIAMTTELKQNEILLILLGSLASGQTMILSYFFGSSAGSKNNADRFANLASQVASQPNPSPQVVDAVKAAAGGAKKKR